MDAKEILNCKLPGDLFSSPTSMESEFKELSKKWHPDKNKSKQAASVQAKINQLHDLGKEHADLGKWEASGRKKMKLPNGKDLVINFKVEHLFELGTMYVCDKSVLFCVKEKDYVKNYWSIVKSFKYASDNMKKEMQKYLPVTVGELKTDDHFILAVEKTEDVFLLKDVLDYHGGKLHPRHVAWILNTMYNISCYLRYLNVAHNGITLNTYFISPKFHSGMLLGGWWYSGSWGDKLTCVPTDVYNCMPYRAKMTKLSDPMTDLESIKQVGRALLGDKNGTKLYLDKDVPKPMISFLRDISSNDAVQEYRSWKEALTESFGAKKFFEMTIDKEKFYKQLTGRS